MAKAKIYIQKSLILIFFLIFSFGQLLRLEALSSNFLIIIQPIDFIVGIFCLYYLLFSPQKKQFFLKISPIVFLLLFSLLFSVSFFAVGDLLKGLFYLLRIISYLIFPLGLKELIKEKIFTKEYFIKALFYISFIIAISGWIQYFLAPDLRYLYYYGWDDHLYRLIGTFLDPGFTGILMVLAGILSLNFYFKKPSFYSLFAYFFFLITVGFTYSRAGYISLFFVSLIMSLKNKKFKLLFSFTTLFITLILFLPRPFGEGVKLERNSSINLRLANYQESLELFKVSPLFGFGFNNICIAKYKYLGNLDIYSHSCSGLDSSVFLILVTTGSIGFLIILGIAGQIYNNILQDFFGGLFISSFLAVLVNSFFINSLFYPWVMGWLGILYSLTYKPTSNSGK